MIDKSPFPFQPIKAEYSVRQWPIRQHGAVFESAAGLCTVRFVLSWTRNIKRSQTARFLIVFKFFSKEGLSKSGKFVMEMHALVSI